jgi:hypothetical protein
MREDTRGLLDRPKPLSWKLKKLIVIIYGSGGMSLWALATGLANRSEMR